MWPSNTAGCFFLHHIRFYFSLFYTSHAAAVGPYIAFDADPNFFACLVRFESSSVPTTLPTAYDVYPFVGSQDGGYDTLNGCVATDFFIRTRGKIVFSGAIKSYKTNAAKAREPRHYMIPAKA
ncbi:hypothetical protein, partial [Salmonella enterica]|uniref:hypothetical protein n=1 Tax=Salmonella enterica TaxID=28901 RepID=UPI0012FE71E2